MSSYWQEISSCPEEAWASLNLRIVLEDHSKKKKKQEFKATGDSRYIYKNELDKTCFQHDMAYGDLKDLPRHSKLLVIQSTIDITMDSYPWSTNTLIKRLVTLVLVEEQESLRIKNWIIKDTEPSQGNLKNAKYIFLWRLGCCS